MKLILTSLALWFSSAPAAVLARTPDAVFLRHAKAQIPEVLVEANRAFGSHVAVDLDTATVPPVGPADLLQPNLLSYSASLFVVPTSMNFSCRRIEVARTDREGTLTFFARAMGPRVQLVRSCFVGDDRAPRVQIDYARETPPRFDDEEVRAVSLPLLEALVRDQASDATLDPATLTVSTPWSNYFGDTADDRGYRDFGPNQTCRRLRVSLENSATLVTAYVDISFDADQNLVKIKPEYQTIVADQRRLRNFRFALVAGCAPWSRRKPPVKRMVAVSPRGLIP